MTTSPAKCLVVSFLAAIILSTRNVNSQIPAACADDMSLMNTTCCPDDCGQTEGRGMCAMVDKPPNKVSSDVRDNWPHYYTHACTCNGNYSGVDCSRCKYGFYGPSCGKKRVCQRQSIQDYSPEEWNDYHNILRMARSYNSGYKVVVGEHRPGTTSTTANMRMVDVSLYTFFIWRVYVCHVYLMCRVCVCVEKGGGGGAKDRKCYH